MIFDVRTFILFSLCMCILKINLIHGKACLASRATVRYVQKCPSNKTAWEARAREKNCNAVAQNCTDSNKFQYHCVINTDVNGTLEVCAERTNIVGGYCVEFNILGAVLQGNSDALCKTMSKPCSDFYFSTEAYKYPECYLLTKKNISLNTETLSTAVVINGGFSTSNLTTTATTLTSLEQDKTYKLVQFLPALTLLIPVSLIVMSAVSIILGRGKQHQEGSIGVNTAEMESLQGHGEC